MDEVAAEHARTKFPAGRDGPSHEAALRCGIRNHDQDAVRVGTGRGHGAPVHQRCAIGSGTVRTVAHSSTIDRRSRTDLLPDDTGWSIANPVPRVGLRAMAGTMVGSDDRLRAFNERLVAGRDPQPGEPHTALEALEAIEAERGPDAVTPRMREIARRIHAAEIDDARSAAS